MISELYGLCDFVNEVLEVNDVSLKRKEEINNDETKRLMRVFLYLFI